MNRFRSAALCLLTFCLPYSHNALAAGFVDVLDAPAAPSNIATRNLLNGITQAGHRLVAVGQHGHILYSDDAGDSWQQARVPVSSDLLAVHFPTPLLGWAVGHDGVVLHSEDAGASWTRQLDGRQVGPRMLEYYQAQAIANPDDENIAALVSEGERMTTEGADKPFLDVWFNNEHVGYIVGAFNLIFRTEDGGRSWIPWMDRTDNPGALNLYAIRPAAGALYIAGEQGLLLKLEPAELRFKAMPSPYNGSFFGIVGTPDVVLAYGLRGNVYRSTDGGAIWSHVALNLRDSITAGTRLPDGRIVLLSQAGHILVSTDQGASFVQAPNRNMQPVAAAAASGPHLLVLAGKRGLHLHSLQ